MILGREEDHADELRALPHERPRRRARLVVELPGGREYPLAGLLPDVGVAVEDAGHGRDRDTAQPRNFVDRRDRKLLSRKRFRDDKTAYAWLSRAPRQFLQFRRKRS